MNTGTPTIYQNEIELITRMSDLDTQRHVTSRTYENFCWEGRQRILAEQGYDTAKLLEQQIRLRPLENYVRFINEQQAGAVLRVITRTYPEADGIIYFDQEIQEKATNKPVCRIAVKSRLENADGPLNIFPDNSEFAEKELLEDYPEFAGECKRVTSPYVMSFSERTIFYDYPISAYWRIFEEGRWHFSQHIGLTEEKIRAIDTITFFMGGNFKFYESPVPGKEYEIHSWAEKIDKIRFYMRQDLTEKGKTKPLMSIREEQLIVSLSRARPKKASPEFLGMVAGYIANPG